MKKFFNKLNRKVNNALISAQCAIENRKAEGYVDTGVKVLIAVVLGALVLSLLYALLKTTVMSNVTTKVAELFNYAGGTV
ncbi:MAG: hypothetical protein IKL09_02550 [Clostridia bacterium]|nr:hypothetical protein [Clostridia bacterium]